MINIKHYQFDGPYTSTNDLMDRPGGYAILDNQGASTYVVDIG